MTHLRSLRDYLAALEQLGEIQHIDKEVDWNLEIGASSAAATTSVLRRRSSPTSPGTRTAGSGCSARLVR